MEAITLSHNSFQNYKYEAFNDNQILHYHLHQAVHCRRSNSLPHCRRAHGEPGPPHYRGSTITLRYYTLGGISLDGWSDRRRYRYVTTHNTHKRQTSMPPAGYERTIPASEQPHTHVLLRTRGHWDRHSQ